MCVLPLVGCPRKTVNTDLSTRVAALLAGRFETVAYARAGLLAGGDYGPLSRGDASNLRFPFFNLRRGLESLHRGASAEVLGASREVLVGAREFLPPGGPPPHLGAVRSRFCYVVLGACAVDLRRYVNEFHAGSIAGREIWQWRAPSVEGEEGPVRFYAVRIAPSYLIVANDIDDLPGRREREEGRGSLTNALERARHIGTRSIRGLRRDE
jgi:hypothetical protein